MIKPRQGRHGGRLQRLEDVAPHGAEKSGAGGYKDVAPAALENIPKGLRHSAQRCPDNGGTTLGGDHKMTQP